MIIISDETFSRLVCEVIPFRHKKQLANTRDIVNDMIEEDKERKAQPSQKQLNDVFRDALGIARITPQDFFKKPKRPNFLVRLGRHIKWCAWDLELEGLK